VRNQQFPYPSILPPGGLAQSLRRSGVRRTFRPASAASARPRRRTSAPA